MEQKRVGMIGLGWMGTALTERLLGAGYEVWGYDLVREKAEPLLAQGARWAENPLAICDRAMIRLYTTETVEQMLRRSGHALRPGQILISPRCPLPGRWIPKAGRWSRATSAPRRNCPSI